MMPWELYLPYATFAHNKTLSKATRMSLFKIVYGVEPLNPLDHMPSAMEEKPSMEASDMVEEI